MTYSIVARDSATGALGIAVQSRYFAAGRVVPRVEAGVGVVASQAFSNPAYGSEGLRLLRSGITPQRALEQLVSQDPGAAMRQVAILDAEGRMAVHTGARCVAAAGHAVGQSCCAQANMMLRETVWDAMVMAFEAARGELADRLLAALEAAEAQGGDVRGRQAAALIVVSGAAPAAATPDRIVDLRVDDHADPVGELKRLLGYSRAHDRAARAIGRLSSGDPKGALDDLDACCTAYPDEPEFLVRRGLVLLSLGRMNEARGAFARARSVHPGWSEVVLRFADAGVVPVGRELLAPLLEPPA
jgi:uncharacterized Ntn-hydrolase superfamily protein